jgi:7 transmembrane receptor (rhodopsin family)
MSTSSTKLATPPTMSTSIHQQNFTYDYHYTMYDYNNSNVTYEYDSEEDITLTFAYLLGDFLTHYYTPFLVFFGSIGNILSVIVFFKTKLRKLSSSYYLAALGISDTCFLLGAFASWLNYVNINIYNRQYYCQFFTYISGLCSFLSVWFVVAFTVERYIAVLYPLKRQTMCTVKRTCMVLAGLIMVGCLICIPYFVYAAPQYSEYLNDYICDVREEYKVSSNDALVQAGVSQQFPVKSILRKH